MKENKKKLAIQFFGHLRTFENTFQSFYQNVIIPNSKNYDIDIFIHSWDEIEYGFESWHNSFMPQIQGKKLDKKEIDFILKNYKPKKFKKTPQLKIKNDKEYIQFSNDKIKFSNIKNMFYSKYEVNNLRLEYEKENNIKYDYVIYTRGDVLFKKEFNLDKILKIYDNELKNYETTENKLFFSGCYRDFETKEEKMIAASDILYFAKSDTINQTADIYLELDKDKNNFVLDKNFISWEYYFFFKIKQKNIKPIQLKYSTRDWHLLRFNEIFTNEQNKKNEKIKNKKLISLRIRKNFISLILNKFYIRLEWGR